MTDPSSATVVAHAPGRVVLIGDHTDHAGGVSLTMAIDRGTTVTGRRGGDRIRLTSAAAEGAVDRSASSAAHPTPDGPEWGRFVNGVITAMQAGRGAGRPYGFAGRIDTTLPVGAGLSSSASLELALALALGFEGSALELARLGQRAEHRAVGVPSGLLDQLTVANGVEGHALLLDLAADRVTPVPVPVGVDVVVVHSGQARRVADSAYAERRSACERAAQLVGPLPTASADAIAAIEDPVLRRRARHVATECQRVRRAADALGRGELTVVGELMLQSHRSLRDDFEVSTPALDETVSRLMNTAGVFGARLTGAGFGGCVVALCEAGAVPDPASVTGVGWRVLPAGPAWVRLD